MVLVQAKTSPLMRVFPIPHVAGTSKNFTARRVLLISLVFSACAYWHYCTMYCSLQHNFHCACMYWQHQVLLVPDEFSLCMYPLTAPSVAGTRWIFTVHMHILTAPSVAGTRWIFTVHVPTDSTKCCWNQMNFHCAHACTDSTKCCWYQMNFHCACAHWQHHVLPVPAEFSLCMHLLTAPSVAGTSLIFTVYVPTDSTTCCRYQMNFHCAHACTDSTKCCWY